VLYFLYLNKFYIVMLPGYKLTIAAALLATVSSAVVEERLEKRGMLGGMMGNNMMGNNMMGNSMMGNGEMSPAMKAHWERKRLKKMKKFGGGGQFPMPQPAGNPFGEQSPMPQPTVNPCTCTNQGNMEKKESTSKVFTQVFDEKDQGEKDQVENDQGESPSSDA
jgi:hypothetical protein